MAVGTITDAQTKYAAVVHAYTLAFMAEHDPELAVQVARAIDGLGDPAIGEDVLAEKRRRVAARQNAFARVERAAYKLAQAVWAAEKVKVA